MTRATANPWARRSGDTPAGCRAWRGARTVTVSSPAAPTARCASGTRSAASLGPPLEGHRNSVRSVAWSPDGRRIVSGSADDTLRLWDAAPTPPWRALEGHTAAVVSVAWSPDGQRVVSLDETARCGLGHAERYAGGQAARRHIGCSSVAWSPDGHRLVVTGGDGSLRSGTRTAASVATVGGRAGPGPSSLAWSPDGRRIVSGRTDGDPISGMRRAVVPIAAFTRGHRRRSPAWRGARTAAVSPPAGADATLRIWDADTGAPTGQPPGRRHDLGVRRCMEPGRAPYRLRQRRPHGTDLGRANGRPDRSVPQGSHGGCRGRGLESRRRAHRLGQLVTAPCVSGTRTPEPRSARRFSPTRREVRPPRPRKVSRVAWSRDGRRIFSGSTDGTVRLWDAATRAEIGLLRSAGAIDASPSGRRESTWRSCPDLRVSFSTEPSPPASVQEAKRADAARQQAAATANPGSDTPPVGPDLEAEPLSRAGGLRHLPPAGPDRPPRHAGPGRLAAHLVAAGPGVRGHAAGPFAGRAPRAARADQAGGHSVSAVAEVATRPAEAAAPPRPARRRPVPPSLPRGLGRLAALAVATPVTVIAAQLVGAVALAAGLRTLPLVLASALVLVLVALSSTSLGHPRDGRARRGTGDSPRHRLLRGPERVRAPSSSAWLGSGSPWGSPSSCPAR